MAKKKRKSGDNAAGVDMSSMIDVVFLLLIFFIVTAKEVIEEAHVAINFPKQEQEKKGGSDDSITITVLPETQSAKLLNGTFKYNDSDKVYRYENLVLNLAELSVRVKEVAELKSEDGKVNIKTDVKAINYRLVQVLDLCGKLGLEKLNLSAAN